MNASHRALREATAGAHARVDTLFAHFDLTDRASYVSFLGTHADALLPLEAALDAAGAERVTPDWPERKRGHLLRADLGDLAVPDTAPLVRAEFVEARSFFSGAGLPFDKLGASGADGENAAIAGTLYVLEGSRLGGKFLARKVPEDFPRRYLEADQAAGAWRTLLDRIDMLLDGSLALQTAIDAALEAFGRFERSGMDWLAKVDA